MLEAGPRPLQLASASIITRNPTRVDEDTLSFHTPPPSATAKSRRRHSSISYIHSGTLPLSHSHPTSPQFPPLGQLRSNNSLSGSRNVKAKRTSYGPLIEDSKMADAVKERPPVTLAEKHAELLHFIAQKESKCLELRSQLAMHEAELLQLKHKWELIVNRGFEKSQTWSPNTSPSPPFLSPSSTSAHHAKSPLTPSSPYFPLPGAHTHAPVLEGIKEGVQGMSRLIAAGFETIAGVPIDPSPSPPRASSHQPLLLRSTPKLDRKPTRRHGQNESQSSSSSTINSTSTFASDSVGTTTNTSIRSSFDNNSSVTAATLIIKNEQNPLENWEESSSPVSDQSEQVLMVRDTGATPTMSPNPDFERKQRSKKRNEKQSNSPVTKNEGEFDPWFGSWDERPLVKNAQASKSPAEPSTAMVPSSSNATPSLPPISTIPGLATMNLAGPAAQQVTSWMGSVGKRLGEIRDSPTFTKNQKRASLLLTDMQNTFVSSLISPSLASSSPLVEKDKLNLSQQSSSLLDESDECEMTGGSPNMMTTPVLVPSVRKSPDDSKTDGVCEILETGSKGGGGGSESEDDWNW